jgi:photosystem II stability/assembly factor-like uncharacterized protein
MRPLALYAVLSATLLPSAAPSAQVQAARQQTAAGEIALDPSTTLSAMRYRHIGPVGNRTTAIAGIPGDANVYYAGAASGGIWKTVDGGVHWTPLFDDKDVSSIGALAVAPSNANVVWAGTGESSIRSHISLGNGVYKSTDAGRTWTKMGLDSTGRIGRIVIHPSNPDIVFVAAQGHSYGPQQERGLFRTTDGGRSWQRVLFVDEHTGAIDVVMHPNDPRTLFAATWQLVIRTSGRESGGPGSGIHVSRDGGTTWTRLRGNGLPRHDVGKIGLAISRSNPNRVYALIETGDGVPWKGRPTDNGELWRSEDGGSTWRVVSYDRNLACRQPYYTRMVVSPDNPDETYFLCATFLYSTDGGVTARPTVRGLGVAQRRGADSVLPAPAWDHHEMWIDPTNANRMAVASDGGVSVSTTRGRSWLFAQLPIAQMYHVTADNRVPYYVYGNKQDGPSYRGPSNSRTGNSIERSEWHGVLGGESGWATPDPVDTNLIWSTASGSGSRGGIVVRYDLRRRQGHNVEVWPLSTGGHPAAGLRYRFIWDFPVHLSPHDRNTLYVGSQYVHATTDGGRSWREISPDLTRNDKSKQQISGGLTPDNIGVEYANTVYSIAESRLTRGLIWVGTNDGLVQLTRDGGRTWTNVTANIPGKPELGTVQHIEPSRYDAGSAYLVVDGHQENNRDPWVYKTKDYGRTWKLVVNGIPKGPLSYAHVIREDPVRRGLLYLGTENALYASFDDGEHWQSLQLNLPPAPVHDMVIQEHFNDLVVGTYGRGFWILDDLSPLQRLTPEVVSSSAHLFAPRAAYRFRNITGNYSIADDPSVGTNPEYGATIHYWLSSTPTDSVSIAILDGAGAIVRRLRGTRNAGLNRVHWDLENESTRPPRMRTKPTHFPEFVMDSNGTRPTSGFGALSVLMPPGRYSVRLTVGGRDYTQPLEVRKDPHSAGSLEEIRAQTDVLLAIQNDLRTAGDMLSAIEEVRAALQRLSADSATGRPPADVRSGAAALEQKLMTAEETLQDLRISGRGQDAIRWPVRIGGQLSYLAGGIASSDFAPTTQQRAVHTHLRQELDKTRTALEALWRTDVPAFNTLLRGRRLPTIDVRLPGAVF